MALIDAVWNRIVAYSGEVFHLLEGKSFTYSVSADTIRLDTGNTDLVQRQIETALDRMPLANPDDLNDLQGPAYIHAILTDRRITGS
jgi:hypothetical protein